MSKAILEFNLPEESEEHSNALNGSSYRYNIKDFDNWLRNKLKYENLSEQESKLFQEVRDKLREFMDELEF